MSSELRSATSGQTSGKTSGKTAIKAARSRGAGAEAIVPSAPTRALAATLHISSLPFTGWQVCTSTLWASPSCRVMSTTRQPGPQSTGLRQRRSVIASGAAPQIQPRQSNKPMPTRMGEPSILCSAAGQKSGLSTARAKALPPGVTAGSERNFAAKRGHSVVLARGVAGKCSLKAGLSAGHSKMAPAR